jgi:hypothetical protein
MQGSIGNGVGGKGRTNRRTSIGYQLLKAEKGLRILFRYKIMGWGWLGQTHMDEQNGVAFA